MNNSESDFHSLDSFTFLDIIKDAFQLYKKNFKGLTIFMLFFIVFISSIVGLIFGLIWVWDLSYANTTSLLNKIWLPAFAILPPALCGIYLLISDKSEVTSSFKHFIGSRKFYGKVLGANILKSFYSFLCFIIVLFVFYLFFFGIFPTTEPQEPVGIARQFSSSWVEHLNLAMQLIALLLPPFIIFVVYQFTTPYIILDNQSVAKAMSKSRKIFIKLKGKLIGLFFCYLFFTLTSAATAGFALILTLPYMYCLKYCFFRRFSIQRDPALSKLDEFGTKVVDQNLETNIP